MDDLTLLIKSQLPNLIASIAGAFAFVLNGDKGFAASVRPYLVCVIIGMVMGPSVIDVISYFLPWVTKPMEYGIICATSMSGTYVVEFVLKFVRRRGDHIAETGTL